MVCDGTREQLPILHPPSLPSLPFLSLPLPSPGLHLSLRLVFRKQDNEVGLKELKD